jgi:hypothetical protein
MARRPVPIFCYPNGQDTDFGPREIATIRELGMAGALVAAPGYATISKFREHPENAFAVRRFSFPDDFHVTAQLVSGIEHLRRRPCGPLNRS